MNQTQTTFDTGDRAINAIPDAWPPAYRKVMWSVLALYTLWLVWTYGARSLWLDETLAAWVTSSDLATCIQRALDFQGQSPLYFMLLWGVRQCLGDSELALRSLSLICVAASGAVTYGILRQLNLRQDAWVGAWMTMLILLSDRYIGLNARPYAPAVLASLSSLYFLLRWANGGSRWMLAGYVVSAVCMILLHYLFAAALAFHGLAILLTCGVRSRRVAGWIVSLPIVALALAPCLPHLSALSGKASRYEFAVAPSPARVLSFVFADPHVLPALLTLGAFAICFRSWRVPPGTARRVLLISIVWWCLGPVGMLIGYYAVGVSLIVPYYLAWRLPAVAALVAAGLRVVHPHRCVVLPVIAVLSVASLFASDFYRPQRTGWREAVEWVQTNRDAPQSIVVYPELIETANPAWIDDERYQPYFRAPVTYYGWNGGVTILPIRRKGSESLFQERLASAFRDAERPVFLVRGSDALCDLIAGKGQDAGFRVAARRRFGHVCVLRFVRPR